mgnify:CR=1 FL=1
MKLADEYYGDSRDWWIIAKYNLKPTEAHIQIGDIIEIITWNDPSEQGLLTQVFVGPDVQGTILSEGFDSTDFDAGDVTKATKLINGGTIGLDDRILHTKQALEALSQ